MQKIWKFWFTKSGVWILKSLLYLQFLLHKKSVSREKFTKSREFTIFTFTKSGVDCTKKKICEQIGIILKYLIHARTVIILRIV